VPVDSKRLPRAEPLRRAGRWRLVGDLRRRAVLVDSRWLRGALVRLGDKRLQPDSRRRDGKWHLPESGQLGSKSLHGAPDPLGGTRLQPASDLPDDKWLLLEFVPLGGRWLPLAIAGGDSSTARCGHWWP